MNFRHTLKRYSQDVTLINKTGGAYDEDTGHWEPGTEADIVIRAPVLPMNSDELRQGEGGTYTADDRKIYLHQQLNRGQEVEIDNLRYLVDAEKDYDYHASGLRIYYLARRGDAGV